MTELRDTTWSQANSEAIDKLRDIGADVGTIVRFIENGTPMGHFYTALFEGDLHTAVTRADSKNKQRIVALTQWIVWYAPSGCVGSREKVAEWGGEEEERKQAWEMVYDFS